MMSHRERKHSFLTQQSIFYLLIIVSFQIILIDSFIVVSNPTKLWKRTISTSTVTKFASTTTTTTTTTTNNDDNDNDAFLPYQGNQPKEASSEIFIPQVLPSLSTEIIKTTNGTIITDDELLWVPQTDTVSFRPLCFCLSNGFYINLLRVRGSGILSRHRHPNPVHGYVLKGSWRYLEHDWIAKEGSYIFEPPGEIHTLVVPDGVDEMITLFHVTGALLYCDPYGKVINAEDVFTKLELAKKHYKEIGLGEDFVEQFIR